MIITYYGKAYFKVSLGDLTIAINPPAKNSSAFEKVPRFGADVALITTNHSDYNGIETVTLGDKEPFVVDGPGSYEIRDLLFTGGASTTTIDAKNYINTVYGFELDGIKIAFLGIMSDEKTLSPEAKDIAASADMLFLPIGGQKESGDIFDAASAYKTATSFGPNVIIPYEYDETSLTRFLKEGGQEKNEAVDKATLKRKDLDGKEGYIIVLTPQA